MQTKCNMYKITNDQPKPDFFIVYPVKMQYQTVIIADALLLDSSPLCQQCRPNFTIVPSSDSITNPRTNLTNLLQIHTSLHTNTMQATPQKINQPSSSKTNPKQTMKGVKILTNKPNPPYSHSPSPPWHTDNPPTRPHYYQKP